MRDPAERQHGVGDISEYEVQVFAQELGCDTEQARKIRDERIYSGWERVFRSVKPFPGVRESLEQLKDAGLKLAALSDFPVGNKLRYFGLEDLFDSIIGFPESGGLKPAPEPFLAMARDLSADPADILYVGNKIKYDVHGSEEAGMRGALIGPPGRKAPPEILAYRDYRHLAESILSEVGQ